MALLFTENKTKKGNPDSTKKRDAKKAKSLAEGTSSASWAASSTADGVTPAWSDSSVDKLQVNIEDMSRLRKLKREEGETHVSGQVYAQRLQEQYTKTSTEGAADLFAWAKPMIHKMSTDDEEPEEEDPITKLLKSNTSVFAKGTHTGLLKPGEKLAYTKLQHANLGSYHGSVVNAVEFHPREEGLMATGGLDRKVCLYSVARNRPS